LALSLEKSLSALRVETAPAPVRGKSARPTQSPADDSLPVAASGEWSPEAALAELAAWMEPRHTLLLRTLIDRTTDVQAVGVPAVAQGVARVIEGLRQDARLKYSEFRERWDARLEPKALLPFLTRNQWIVPHEDGGVVLTGKGMRKEARMLYLQTGHDMATDCARQWASLAGRLQAFQTSFASEWHAAAVMKDDDASRLLPTLEATLRDAEFEAWKKMRLSLGEIAEEAFIKAVLKWETRPAADEEALVRGLLHPWVKNASGRNGWAGYMRALSSVAERMALAMLDHYQRKWELYLRGLPRAASPAV